MHRTLANVLNGCFQETIVQIFGQGILHCSVRSDEHFGAVASKFHQQTSPDASDQNSIDTGIGHLPDRDHTVMFPIIIDGPDPVI